MAGARAYQTEAIVLRARNLGEADKIVTLLTTGRGKIDAVAKGVRRTKSHFGARLELLSVNALMLHRGRNLDVITSAELVRSHWEALVDPAAFATAHLFAELVDAFCEHDLPVPEVYLLLADATAALARAAEPSALVARFELRLLYELGIAVPGDACVRCGRTLDDGAWLDLDSPGLACEACRRGRGAVVELQPHDLAHFRVYGGPRGHAAPATAATAALGLAADALVTHHLGKRAKSLPAIDDLRAQVRRDADRRGRACPT